MRLVFLEKLDAVFRSVEKDLMDDLWHLGLALLHVRHLMESFTQLEVEVRVHDEFFGDVEYCSSIHEKEGQDQQA